MNTLKTFKMNDDRVKFLICSDDKLSKLITYIGDVELEIEENGFRCIIKYIIGQQISDKARETIWCRLCNLCKVVSPVKIFNLPNEKLRAIGISNRKIDYMKNLSVFFIENEKLLDTLPNFSNEKIIEILTSVKGIGSWTAEMYLIFSLGRTDVLSKSDGTIRRSIQWMYRLDALPNENELTSIFEKWKGYETIVSAYFWKSISLGLQRNTFDNIFFKGGNLYEHET